MYPSLASHRRPRSDKCFLANVLDRRRRTQSATELEFDESAKILGEVLLRPRISRTKPLQIQCVKSVEFHWLLAPLLTALGFGQAQIEFMAPLLLMKKNRKHFRSFL